MSDSFFLPLVSNAAAWAWSTSLLIAAPALLLLALGRWRKFPSRSRWIIGAVVLVRLLLPAVPALPEWRWMPTQRLVPAGTPTVVVQATHSREVAITGSETAIIEPAPASHWLNALPIVWASGVLVVLAWIGLSHRVIQRRIGASARPCRDERVHQHLRWAADRMGMKQAPALAELKALPTVALSGWWRPRILVPDGFCERFTPDEVRGIFLHELAHVKRHDVLWTWLGLMASALHWFNPLVWLTVRRFGADRELECDRIALALLDDTQRQPFGEALLKTLEAHQWPASAALVPFAQRQPEIRTRILMITQPITTRWAKLLSLVAVPALVLLTLTTAGADGEKEPGKAREGEGAKKAGTREGEGTKKTGARDGEGTKTGARDGEARKTGARDGETKKTGMRDGEGTKRTGARDGEGAKKTGARDGEGGKKASAESGAPRKGAEPSASNGNTVLLRVLGAGESVSVDGKSMPANELRAYLSEYLPEHKGSAVVIEADDSAPSKSVAEVLDAARDNGAKKATVRSK